MEATRASGVLLHVTSLPDGTLGRDARRFVDWLVRAGQRWWQVLPLGPPDRFRSPYAAASAFALSPALLAGPRARVTRAEVDAFRDREAYWVADWERFAGPVAVEQQVRVDRSWRALRAYAAERGVRLLGDVPIYVAAGSADHVAHPELFRSGVVAGAPPDALSWKGQVWGNPLYDWPALRRRGYRWWIERFRRTFELFDAARIDHFRGFVAAWEVPEGHTTARRGRWRRGPGAAPFRAAERELGPLPLVAEDLGLITPPVHRLRDALGFPGMVVLEFAFGGGRDNPHRVENHRERAVVYPSTHDTDTAVGWFSSLRRRRRRETGLDPDDPAWSLLRLAFSSRAQLAIVQMQDILRLGSEARMNSPGRAQGNWRWRLEARALSPALADRLREETEAAGRVA